LGTTESPADIVQRHGRQHHGCPDGSYRVDPQLRTWSTLAGNNRQMVGRLSKTGE
jgi:hypothetical protein